MKRNLALFFVFIFVFFGCGNSKFIEVDSLPNEIENLSVIVNTINSNELLEWHNDELKSKVLTIVRDYLKTLSLNQEGQTKAEDFILQHDLTPQAVNEIETFIQRVDTEIKNSQAAEAARIRGNITNGLNSEVSRIIYVNQVNTALAQKKINETQANELLAFIDTKLIVVAAAERRARAWGNGEYVDQFGDATGRTFIFKRAEGTFSNSATRNSRLDVSVLFSDSSFGFSLYEYGRDRGVEASFIGTRITISFRNEKNEDFVFSEVASGGRVISTIYIHSGTASYNNLKRFFERSEEVRVVIRDTRSSVYNFTLDTKFFNES